MSFFYSSVPLVNPKKCPLASHHNLIAKAFNQRLSNAGPACAWAIFYYADGIFTGMRNTATPGQPRQCSARSVQNTQNGLHGQDREAREQETGDPPDPLNPKKHIYIYILFF